MGDGAKCRSWVLLLRPRRPREATPNGHEFPPETGCGGLEKIPARIVQAFWDQGRVIGGRNLGLGEVVEMLQDISSSRPTFICIDALDECMAEYRAKLLDSLNQILHRSPSTRIFLAGRLHVRDEVEKHLSRRVVTLFVVPRMILVSFDSCEQN